MHSTLFRFKFVEKALLNLHLPDYVDLYAPLFLDLSHKI